MEKTHENLCRLCGNEGDCPFEVFMKLEDSTLLADLIRDILNISISQDDKIPKEVCTVCHTFLINFLKFREMAQKTQLFFVDMTYKIENEKGPAPVEDKDSTEFIKSESTTFNDDLPFSSDDEIFPFIKAAIEESSREQKKTRKPLKRPQDLCDSSQDAISNHSFNYDEENTPLIKFAAENSPKRKTKTRKTQKTIKQEDALDTIKSEELQTYQSVELFIENALDNPEECNICQKQFTKERYLRHHLRITHKIFIESKYPCNRCTRKFMQKLSWERHQKLHDDPNFNKPMPCDICGKFYINKQTLRAHIRSIHMDNEKKFVCEECGAQFKGISSLKVHQITHTGEYPFECSKCDRRFQSKANLFVHLDTHTETPYVCKICQKHSTTLRGLRLHMVNHSDDKPHKCHMCSNAYKRVTALKKHLIVHSGIKPYSCNFCERTFADGSNKRIHMKRVHKKELADMEAAGLKVIPAVLPKIQQLREDGITIDDKIG